jgi:hypothetical protein
MLTSGVVFDPTSPQLGTPLGKEDVERGKYIKPESRVLMASPFAVKPVEAFGLQLRMSDGSTQLIVPIAQEPDEPEDEGLPTLADWELSSPRGLLQVGPDLQWSFKSLENGPPLR